jgi:hypothetical protein
VGVKLKGILERTGETVEIDSEDFATLAKLLRFNIKFDMPNLDQGIPIYVPNVDEWLYNLWIDILIPFNTKAFADFTVIPAVTGLCAIKKPPSSISAPYTLDAPISANGIGNDIRPGSGSILALSHQSRIVPAKFLTSDPLKAYITQEGKCDGTGTPIDSTAGEILVFMLILPGI